jgi:hypothetical protein
MVTPRDGLILVLHGEEPPEDARYVDWHGFVLLH